MKYSFVILMLTFLASCTSGTGQTQANSDKLPPRTFSQKLEQTPDKIILDVRTPDEFKEGHIKSALNVDWNGEHFDAEVEKLNKNRPVYVYCYAGGRSASAAKALQKKGFKEIHDLEGGMSAWREAGLPEEK